MCTSETGIFGFLHSSYFKPTYLSFWDSMHDGPQIQPEMFFLDIDRFSDGQAKLLEDGSPVMVRAALTFWWAAAGHAVAWWVELAAMVDVGLDRFTASQPTLLQDGSAVDFNTVAAAWWPVAGQACCWVHAVLQTLTDGQHKLLVKGSAARSDPTAQDVLLLGRQASNRPSHN